MNEITVKKESRHQAFGTILCHTEKKPPRQKPKKPQTTIKATKGSWALFPATQH